MWIYVVFMLFVNICTHCNWFRKCALTFSDMFAPIISMHSYSIIFLLGLMGKKMVNPHTKSLLVFLSQMASRLASKWRVKGDVCREDLELSDWWFVVWWWCLTAFFKCTISPKCIDLKTRHLYIIWSKQQFAK